MPDTKLVDSPQWRDLVAHQADVADLNLRDLFAADPTRGRDLTAQAGDIYLDYSKNLITRETLPKLLRLCDTVNLRARIDAMYDGERINKTSCSS